MEKLHGDVGRSGGGHCKVKNCNNTTKSKFSFFKVPTDPERKEAWCRQVEIEFSDRVNPSICETHFTQNQFVCRQRTRLKSNAVPTISNKRDRCKTVTVCKRLVQAHKSVLTSNSSCEMINTQDIALQQNQRPQFQESGHAVKRAKIPEVPEFPGNTSVLNIPHGSQSYNCSNNNGRQPFQVNSDHLSPNRLSAVPLPVLQPSKIQQPSTSIHQSTQLFQLQQPPSSQNQLETHGTQPCQLIFLGMGNNGVPCFAQIQVPLPQPSTSQPSNVGSEPSIFTVVATDIADVDSTTQTCLDPDSTEKCMMCQSMSLSTSRMKAFETFIETRKVIGKFFKILNLNMNLKDEWEIGENDKELPFCLSCLRQVTLLVKTQDELEILRDRFDSLKSDILSALLHSFCQVKAGQEKNEESAKLLFEDLSVCIKMRDKLSRSTLQQQAARTPLRSTVAVIAGTNPGKEIEFPQDSEHDWQIEEPKKLGIQCDENNFGFRYSQNSNDADVTDVEPEPDPLALPDVIGDIEIEACFKATKGKQYEIKKWEALYNCPATRPGLENLLPLKLRRIKCPICKKKVPGDRLSHHVVKFHSLNEQKKCTGIKEYIAACTQMVKGKERRKIMRVKFRALSKFSVKEGTHMPNHYKRVNCPICNKEMGLSCLSAHINIHNGEKPFKCPDCPKRFYSQPNLLDHRVFHTTSSIYNTYACDLCCTSNILRVRRYYVTHILDVHSDEVSVDQVFYFYNCDAENCVESYRQKEQFIRHLKTHNADGVVFVCQNFGCEKVFASACNLESHVAEVHSDKTRVVSALFDCKYCIKFFQSEKEWKKHELTHSIDMSTEQRRHLCEECGAAFKTLQGIMYHRRSEFCNPTRNGVLSQKMERRKKIPEDLSVKSKSRVTIKKKSVLQKKPNTSCLLSRTCHICGKIIKQRKVMVNHLLDTHTYENKLHCYICLQDFEKRTYLESHIRRHLGQPRVTSKEKCKFCGELLPGICPLRRHCIENHAEEYLKDKPFYCPICWLRFENQEEAAAHQMIQHERWKCKICDKQLRNRFTFEYHSRIHSSEKPFICNFCNKGFNLLSNMRVHILRHRGIKPFYCIICLPKLGFYRKKQLKNHMDSVHPDSV